MPVTLKPAFAFVAMYLARQNADYCLLALKLQLSKNFFKQTLTSLDIVLCAPVT